MVVNQDNQSQSSTFLDDWLCRIRQLHDKDIDMGLVRIGEVASKMGLRHLDAKVILIAGTNGKGTTSRFLEAYLLSLGLRVGLFNSPALLDYTETVRIDSEPLSASAHVTALEAVWHQRGDVILTEFEFSTLAALYLFSHSNVDYVLMEVGMGGRSDSTNVVEPDLSVITTIAIDHQQFLGDTREAIGYQKAGIFRPNQIAVVGDLNIPASVYQYGEELKSELVCADRDYRFQADSQSWSWQDDKVHLQALLIPQMPMQNVATAIACIRQLDLALDSARVNQVLVNLTVEGRLETISDKPYILVDVAHNVEAAKFLAKHLQGLVQQRKISAVVGMLKDKDIDGVLAAVASFIDKWYVCQLQTPRSASSQQMVDALRGLAVQPQGEFDTVEQGLQVVIEQLPNDGMVLVFGSFFTVAEAKVALG